MISITRKKYLILLCYLFAKPLSGECGVVIMLGLISHSTPERYQDRLASSQEPKIWDNQCRRCCAIIVSPKK